MVHVKAPQKQRNHNVEIIESCFNIYLLTWFVFFFFYIYLFKFAYEYCNLICVVRFGSHKVFIHLNWSHIWIQILLLSLCRLFSGRHSPCLIVSLVGSFKVKAFRAHSAVTTSRNVRIMEAAYYRILLLAVVLAGAAVWPARGQSLEVWWLPAGVHCGFKPQVVLVEAGWTEFGVGCFEVEGVSWLCFLTKPSHCNSGLLELYGTLTFWLWPRFLLRSCNKCHAGMSPAGQWMISSRRHES